MVEGTSTVTVVANEVECAAIAIKAHDRMERSDEGTFMVWAVYSVGKIWQCSTNNTGRARPLKGKPGAAAYHIVTEGVLSLLSGELDEPSQG